MARQLRQIWQHHSQMRFLVTGALNTFVGLAVYPMLYLLFTPKYLHYLSVLTLSYFINVSFAFTTTKVLVFRTTGNIVAEFCKYGTYHLVIYLINMLVLPLLVEYFCMNPVWAQILFGLVVIVSSYFWHSRITFIVHSSPNR